MQAEGIAKVFIALICALSMGSCADRDSARRPTATTLSGQVFAQSPEGTVIKAVGRTVRLSKADSAGVAQAEAACEFSRQQDMAMVMRIAGKRAVGPEEMPVEDQETSNAYLLTLAVRMAFEWAGELVATTSTDINGNYSFDSLLPGKFVITVSHEQGAQDFSWTSRAEVLPNRANVLTLGSDAAGSVTLCSQVIAIKMDLP